MDGRARNPGKIDMEDEIRELKRKLKELSEALDQIEVSIRILKAIINKILE